ncbi:uncharacterized protein BO87DRAFT_320224 [Aspergillus neoniger CBS 115656]|uniref:Uncharacterized protein n=1 Tax=Aspergillus neoniger (strain CBS 115656) TaxID=1448310 RepID=A0A318Y4Z0_ASPNB|nr:hypothetical protein BO87DRAFT_320224 [Aspergillus neoniger CBS 115656]PYH29305.1 hypothetical protein BO87DRAFT_320224 [Aspergillus neoniger CBS 115656]
MNSAKDWDPKVRIPRTPAEWALMAGEAKIPPLAEGVKADEDYPAGQPALYLDMHKVGHWESASKVSEAHFLLTRCLWKFSNNTALSEWDSYPDPMINPKRHESFQPAMDWLSKRPDWRAYVRDIQENTNKRPDPGQAKSLGEFTSTRHWQLCVRDGEKQNNERDNSPPVTRSRARQDLPSVEMQADADGSSDLFDARPERTTTVFNASGSSNDAASKEDDSSDRMSGVLKTMSRSSGSSGEPSANVRESHMRMDEMHELTTYETRSSCLSFGALAKKMSAQSATTKEEASITLCRTSDEETVNMALVEFLSALTRCYPHVHLEWKADRQFFEVDLGKAQLRAKSDGGLFSRQSDIFALVEVKPFVLMAAPETTFRQMSMEMVAWIAHAMRNPQDRRKAYVLLHYRTHPKSKPFSNTLEDTTW